MSDKDGPTICFNCKYIDTTIPKDPRRINPGMVYIERVTRSTCKAPQVRLAAINYISGEKLTKRQPYCRDINLYGACPWYVVGDEPDPTENLPEVQITEEN